LCNIFNDLETVNECALVIGDMNIDIRGKVDNDYLDTMAPYGFKSFVKIFTRIPAYGACSFLDHIFIKAPQKVLDNIEAGVIQTQITDVSRSHYRAIKCFTSKNIFVHSTLKSYVVY
jgi:hypothetical protein